MTSGFTDAGLPVGQSTVGDFWQWAYSSMDYNVVLIAGWPAMLFAPELGDVHP